MTTLFAPLAFGPILLEIEARGKLQKCFNPMPQKHSVLGCLTYRLVNVPLNGCNYKEEYTNVINNETIGQRRRVLENATVSLCKPWGILLFHTEFILCRMPILI